MVILATAGLAALIRQYYTEGWYPSQMKNPPWSFNTISSIAESILINLARNMTGV